MIFYALHIPSVDKERIELLRVAAKRLTVGFRAVDPFSADFLKPSPAKAGDIVYRVSRGKLLRVLEDFMIQPGVATFYADPFLRGGNPFTLMKHGIPTPRTIFCASKNRDELVRSSEELGGFPIVIKALGGTRGLGVMKIDSYSALFSMVDFLLSQNKFLTLSEYIPVRRSARFLVLGGKVIGSYEYIAKDHDFRTNVAQSPEVRVKKYSKHLQEIAVQATHAFGWEFGGVDMLIHEGKPYITEVNFPCNFVRAQTLLKRDIALEMVQYLRNKSRA